MPTGTPDIIQTTALDSQPVHAIQAREPKLVAACQDFEGLLLGFILKQGLTAEIDEEEESGGNTSMLTDFAAEQTARELGRSGSLGIADLLYEQISGQRTHPAPPASVTKGAL